MFFHFWKEYFIYVWEMLSIREVPDKCWNILMKSVFLVHNWRILSCITVSLYQNNVGAVYLNVYFTTVCLSTVDRRSRERFVESNHQISALVEKFKIEGGIYRKGTVNHPMDHGLGLSGKIPLLLEKPGTFRVGWTLFK